MLWISLLGGIAMVGSGFIASKVATGFSQAVRQDLFARVESFSLVEFNTFSTASLITRTTNDIQQIQSVYVMMLRMVLMAPIMGIGAVIKAYQSAPSITWIMVLAISILLAVIVILFSTAVPKFKILQSLVDRLNLVTRESLTGMRVIRAFNQQPREEERFDQANQDLTRVNLFVNRLMVIMQPVMTLIMSMASLGIIWFGSQLVGSDSLSIGGVMAFLQYAMQAIMSFLLISIVAIMLPRASVSANRVAQVIETEPTIKDAEDPRPAPQSGLVQFERVSFTYPGASEPAIQDISFEARPGQITAVIGSTGSGKSTLANLIPRFYDATSGVVKIDGIDVRALKLEDLYARIGFIPQKAVLFSGTVKSNIAYGAPKATDEQIEHAAQTAQALDFIKELEHQFDHPIAQGGGNVSGGQKQRLAIARALLLDPEIYIFDDSFSALDFKTDAALRQALFQETAHKTVLIVAQRISTIMQADQIIVLDEGQMVGMGTHEELMKSCQVYHEIALSQLSESEL